MPPSYLCTQIPNMRTRTQVTMRRSVCSTLQFRPLFEIPRNVVIFAANVYALSLIPTLTYRMFTHRCVCVRSRGRLCANFAVQAAMYL